MNTQIEDRGRPILIHGLLLVMVGLIWGFAVPLAPYPRLALGAHIQFVTNGLLIIVMAILLLKLPHHVGPKSATVMLVAAYLTWLMALSEAANAWWGANQMLPIAAGQAGAVGGEAWQEWVVKLTHLAAGLGLLAAWGLLVAGFLRTSVSEKTP
jgi:hydroxylaminobenzene mutase